MFTVPLLLIGLIIFIVFFLGGSTNHAGSNQYNNYSHKHNNDRAIEILNERFAKGEINEEEYKRMKRSLES